MNWPGVLERFTLQSDVFVTLLVALGASKVEFLATAALRRSFGGCRRDHGKRKQRATTSTTNATAAGTVVTAELFLLLLGVVGVVALVLWRYESMDQSSNWAIEVYGKVSWWLGE